MIGERLPATACLAGASILLSLIVAIPLGIYAASKPKLKERLRFWRYFTLMMATPNFFVGLVVYLSVCHRIQDSSFGRNV